MICINGNIDFSGRDLEELKKKFADQPGIVVLTQDTVLYLTNVCKWTIPIFPNPAYRKAYSLLLASSEEEADAEDLPWRKILGTKQYFEACLTYARTVLNSLNALPGGGYVVNVALGQHKKNVLDKLGHSKTNNATIKQHAINPSTSLSQKEILRSFIFKPSNPSWDASRNLLYPPQSTLCHSRTGRSRLLSGPNLGHLQKEFRDVIESRFGSEGSVWYLDYTSLEPRVLLLTSRMLKQLSETHPFSSTTETNDLKLDIGQIRNTSASVTTTSLNNNSLITHCFNSVFPPLSPQTPIISILPQNRQKGLVSSEVMGASFCPHPNNVLFSEKDIYSDFLKQSNLANRIPREVAKRAIISVLYGQSQKNFEDSLSQYVSDPQDLYDGIEEYFGIQEVKNMLHKQLAANNGEYILNFYGRPVFPENAKEYALINYFTQSTAVDVAFFGFANVINAIASLGLRSKVIPIHTLHDAIVLDVHESCVGKLELLANAGSQNIPGYGGNNFYLSANLLTEKT